MTTASSTRYLAQAGLHRLFRERIAYRKDQRRYRQLLGLSDHLLRDMGLPRHEIMRRSAMAYAANSED